MDKSDSPHQLDQWMVAGQPTFGTVPGGVLAIAPAPAPIYLFYGDHAWGARHIHGRHGGWVSRHASSVPELVWTKCQSSGAIWACDDNDKTKISLSLTPAALLVLKYLPQYPCYSVVTLYSLPVHLDGTKLGRYRPVGPARRGALPAFELVSRDRAAEIRASLAQPAAAAAPVPKPEPDGTLTP